MSRIEELNDQVLTCAERIEQHLDSRATALVTTASVSVTLATALAVGVGVLSRDALPQDPGLIVTLSLAAGGLLTVASLFLGVLAYVTRSSISRRAVEMWSASKESARSVLDAGRGDERATELAFQESFPGVASLLEERIDSYEKAFERLADLVAWQATLLTLAVLLVLICAFTFYSGVSA